MLVLARKKDETIFLLTSDGLVTIMVTEVHGELVRLGIDAPISIKIYREEVYEEIMSKLINKKDL